MSQQHDNFVNQIENQVNKTLVQIRKLRDIAGKRGLEWYDEEVDQVFSVLRDELEQAEAAFRKPDDAPFKLAARPDAPLEFDCE